MFFLISYGLLNYATYYEAQAASPSFRPTFKWFHKRLSLFGFLACLGVMPAINLTTGFIAISVLFAIFRYLRRTADPARWADIRRAHHLQRARENLLAAWLEGGSGLTTVVTVMEGKDLLLSKRKEAAEAKKAADTAEGRLKKAMSQTETDVDNAQIATLRADRDKAVEAAERLRRRAVRARAKAEQVQEALEKDEAGPETGGDKGEP